MSLRAIGGKLIKHGTALIRQAHKGKPSARNISDIARPVGQPSLPVQKTDWIKNNKYCVFRNLGVQVTQRARRVLIDDVLNQVAKRSGEFQKAAQRRLYGNSAPLLSLVGVAVVGQGLLTKDEELEGVCWEIRECMTKIQWNRDNTVETLPEDTPVNLQSFTFGKPIAKGANAVVYSVQLKEATNLGQSSGTPFALKMMFNYDIQSNSRAT